MMAQQPRREEPLYSCTVPVESLTGNLEEEIVAFGGSEETAREQARILLSENYSFSDGQILQLMQQADVVSLSPWCTTEGRAEGASGDRGDG